MLGLFIKDKQGVYLRNKYFHHYDDHLPEAPFILIHDGDLYESNKELTDEPIPGHNIELVAEVFPRPGRWYEMRLGNFPARQNLSKFAEKNHYRSTVISLVTKSDS
jgi:hypothetical protein